WWYDDGTMTTDMGPAQGHVKVFITVDLAISTKQSADPTVMAVWGLDNARRLYLLALERKRIPAPSQARLIERLNRKWNPHTILVEDVAYQRAFVQHAASKGLPVKGVRPQGNKLARSVAASDMMQRGHIAFPMTAPWLDTLHGELLAFPNGRHDDIVDALSYAAQHAQTKRRRVSLKGWTLDPDLIKPRGI
ncbi:phage terminase large subunit, partial [Actinomycetota bacterium]